MFVVILYSYCPKIMSEEELLTTFFQKSLLRTDSAAIFTKDIFFSLKKNIPFSTFQSTLQHIAICVFIYTSKSLFIVIWFLIIVDMRRSLITSSQL